MVNGAPGESPLTRPAVLVVEDDAETRRYVSGLLEEVGADVVAASSIADAKRRFATRAWGLVVADRMLPDGSGLDWVRELRAAGDPVPVLVLTALRDVIERVAGLESGADDYLGKPFAPLELKARVRALLRRRPPGRRRLASGRLRIDVERQEAFVGGEELPLTERELRVLVELVASEGVRRDDLLERVWGDATPETAASLDVILSRLRRKLAAHGLPGVIETVRGWGLRWRGAN